MKTRRGWMDQWDLTVTTCCEGCGREFGRVAGADPYAGPTTDVLTGRELPCGRMLRYACPQCGKELNDAEAFGL